MKKVVKFLSLIFFVFILVGCTTPVQLPTPKIEVTEEGQLIITPVDGASYYEVIINDEEYYTVTADEEFILPSDLVVKVKAVADDKRKYLDSEYVEVKYVSQSKKEKLLPPQFTFNSEGKVIIEPQLDVEKYIVYITGIGAVEYKYGEEIYVQEGQSIQIKAIPNDQNKYYESDYSETKTFYSDSGIEKLPVPTFTVNDEYEIIVDEYPYSSTFEIVINDVESKIITAGENVFVGDDCYVKIRALSEDLDKYLDSEFGENIYIEKVKYLNKVYTWLDPEAENKFHISSGGVDTVWAEINDEIVEIKIKDLSTYPFQIGDNIRFKYKAPNAKYIENEEWSDLIIYWDYASLDYIELSKNKNNLENLIDNEDGTYTYFAKSNQGKEIELLISGQVKKAEKGWTIIGANTEIVTMTPIHGLSILQSYDEKGSSLEANERIKFSFGVDTAQQERLQSKDDIVTGACPVIPQYKEIMIDVFEYNVNHLKIINQEQQDVELSEYRIYFTGEKFEIKNLEWNYDFFVSYIRGEKYEISREQDPLDYYLLIETYSPIMKTTYIHYSSNTYEVGDLKNKDSEVVSKTGRRLEVGDTIEMIVGDYLQDLIITIDVVEDKYTNHELVSHAYPSAEGVINNIVIPIYWNDQVERKNDKNLEAIYKVLGNVIDENGNIKTYTSDQEGFVSLSEYFAIASYNQLQINSFVTEWYHYDADYSYMKNRAWEDNDLKVMEWFKEKYSSLDMSLFDKDGNALFDSIIFINTGDMTGESYYNRTGLSGAFRYRKTYIDDYAGTLESPGINTYINLNLGFLFDDQRIDDSITGITSNTLVHEYGHVLGLVDYYDTRGSYSALGKFDMQDANKGDWNPYSKYSVGWIDPIVVTENSFNGQNSIDIKIESFTLTGNTILIPAKGYDYNGTPYDEYIMLELFTPDGLQKLPSKFFGLENTIGVRMYHVNALHEKRTLTNDEGESFDIGTIHQTNTTSFNTTNYGYFLIETIQADKENTLTKPFTTGGNIEANDFFKQGDVFNMSEYTQFFYEGLMDNGMEFGYIISIKEINTLTEIPYAIITISK